MLSDTIVQTQHTVKQAQKKYAEQAAKKEQERKQQEAKRQKDWVIVFSMMDWLESGTY